MPSPASADADGLFAGLFARGPAAATVTDRAWIAAMLDAEVALAQASADAGRLDPDHAARIAAAADPDAFDPAALGRAAAEGAGNPVPALVRTLVERVDDGTPEGREAAGAVHRGATSQDVVDTAAMLIVRRALAALRPDLQRAADACADLAAAHRDTPIVGRTLMQQAVPTTFGLKAAGWLVGLDDARGRVDRADRDDVAAQLGGAVGTLAALGDDGIAVHAAFAAQLGLAEPTVPWHTSRTRVVAITSALATVAAAVGKVAGDIVLLAQTEVGEVHEDPAGGGSGRGGSSTMPHKRNPVAAVSARACAMRVPGLVATLVSAAGSHEHERAAGAWHAEWEPLTELLRVTGSAVAWLAESLPALRVDRDRMRENLDRTGGLIMTEAVVAALTPTLGRLPAHDRVSAAARRAVDDGVPLRDVLRADPEIDGRLGTDGIDRALDPARYVGSAGAFVDRALAAHRAAGDAPPDAGPGRGGTGAAGDAMPLPSNAEPPHEAPR
ncbi:MAG: 3-carboxy-cis,cis-muconate cycloisomerase [Solirubrobacteraceae bacterium]